LSQSTRLTDEQMGRWTDRQKDRILIDRPRLHSMQRGKNVAVNHQRELKLDNCRPVAYNNIADVTVHRGATTGSVNIHSRGRLPTQQS